MTTKQSGGIDLHRVGYSESAGKVFAIAIDHRRTGFILSGNVEQGMRFKNNESVLARLESMHREAEFMADIGPCIDRALLDAAQSDYWYNHEKDYEWPDCPSDETEIADDEDE